jgi:hypothetical protein
LFGRNTGTSTSKGEIRRTAGFRGVPWRSAESGHDLGHGWHGAHHAGRTLEGVPSESWRRDFPELLHEPQDLDLVRRHLAWTPAERMRNLKQVNAFVDSAHKARFHAVPVTPVATNR